MRLPHHLLRHPSGVFHFRLVVPADVQSIVGLKIIKKSLRTRDPTAARGWAYVLSARYAQAFAQARAGQGGGMGKGYRDGLTGFEIERAADGALTVRTDGSEGDNAAALAALKLLGSGLAPGQSPPPPLPPSTAPTLGMAIRSYTEIEAPTLKPNTWAQRERNFKLFMTAVGPGLPVDRITRPMAAAWAADLLRAGRSKRYVANCVSHLAQLFEAAIRAGHIPRGQNPVKGVVVLKASEKKALRAKGHAWEPFDIPTLQKIFNPTTYKQMRGDHLRWAPLMGLYTGARVSELAQLHLRDFFEAPDGIKCLRITADSDGQSLKTEASQRVVPIHPDLLELGLWGRVEALRNAGKERLFPDMRVDSRAGAGNAVTKGFSYYLRALGIHARREAGIVGFHSFRKTVIQTLQASNLTAERRRALVGHEPGEDVHASDYMRAWTPAELATFFPELHWGAALDLKSIRQLFLHDDI